MDRATTTQPGGPTVTTGLLPAETSPALTSLSQPPARAPGAWAWAIGLGLLVFDAVAVAWGRTLGPDTYISLTAGREIAARGLPHSDRLSAAGHGLPWIDQQWLAHIAFYGLWRTGGDAAVGAGSAAAIGLAIGLLFALCIRRGAGVVPAWIAAGGAFVACLMYAETRAQSFAYPLFVALLWIVLSELDRDRLSARALLVVPLLALWANLHGSVLIGAAVVTGCFGLRTAASMARRRWRAAGAEAAVSILAAAAVLVTPYGLSILDYYPRVLGDPALGTIAEWQPSSFAILDLPFVALLLGTVGVACFARGRGARLRLAPVLIAAGLAAMATHAIRYQVWFGLGAAPLLAATLTTIRRDAGRAFVLPRRVAGVAAATIAAVTLAVAATVASTPASTYNGFVSATATRSAAAYAVRHPGTRILADDSTGSALLWLFPSLAGRVGFDARAEIFPPARMFAFARFLTVSGRNWTAATRGYQVLAITCTLHPGLCPAIRRLPGWRVLAARDGGLVAVRRSPAA